MLSRRLFLIALAGVPLGACNDAHRAGVKSADESASWYIGTMPDHPFPVPLVDRRYLPADYLPQTVSYQGGERPGTVVVDIDQRFLYFVEGDGTAIRYAVGVGRQGFSWKGAAYVGRKSVWPNWSPTSTMVKLHRDLPRYVSAGLDNPLGARALYLYQAGRDILFRIHGTNEPWKIGEAASSGCIRMLNEDVVDLYDRVPVGATVLVRRGERHRA
jgi:lipoprotein-anchoring transpeptidase ErfK/SrfK